MEKGFVVLNPMAGESGTRVRKRIEAHFEGAGWGCEVYETTGEERIAGVVRSALAQGEADMFVAAGGDGTVSGVAGGLVGTGVPLGVVPLGTGDTFARELRIPLDTEEALKLLTGSHALMEMDAMRANERYFVLNVSVGLSGLIMRDTPRAEKRRFGRIAYAWTGLRKLLGYQPHHFRLSIDGERWAMWASEVMIANSGALGDPSLRWSPKVELNDGRIDVCIVRARTALDYARIGVAVLLGRQSQEPAMRHFIAEQSVAVDAEPELPVQGDGEFLGRVPVMVTVVPSAVNVAVPEEGRDGHVPGRIAGLGK